MNPHRLRAYFLLLIVAAIWGIAGPVIKLTLKNLPPDIFLGYRFFLSSIIAAFLISRHRGQKPKGVTLWSKTLFYAFLNSTASLGFLFWGMSKTTLLDMSLLSLFGPILMMILGYLFLHEHMTHKMKFGAFVAFLGSAIIAVEPFLANGHTTDYKIEVLFGNLLIFLSLVSGAFSGLLVKKLMRENISPSFLSNFSFIVGFVTLVPIILIGSSPTQVFTQIKSASFLDHLGVVYMAVISGVLAYSLNNIAQKTIELSEAAIFSYIYPVISAILAVIILRDKITTVSILASMITIFGVFIAEFTKGSKHKLKR